MRTREIIFYLFLATYSYVSRPCFASEDSAVARVDGQTRAILEVDGLPDYNCPVACPSLWEQYNETEWIETQRTKTCTQIEAYFLYLPECQEGYVPPPTPPPSPGPANSTLTIMEYVSLQSTLSFSYKALIAAGLSNAYTFGGPYTAFFPDNKAWEEFLMANSISEADFLSNTQAVNALISYLVFVGIFYKNNAPGNSLLFTQRSSVDFFLVTDASGSNLYLNNEPCCSNVPVSSSGVGLRNGIVNIVSQVILPAVPFEVNGQEFYPSNQQFASQVPDAALGTIYDLISANPDLTVCKETIDANKDIESLMRQQLSFTIFCPNDAAYNAWFSANNLNKEEYMSGNYVGPILVYQLALGQFGPDSLVSLKGDLPPYNVQAQRYSWEFTATNGVASSIDGANIEKWDYASNGIVYTVSSVFCPPGETSYKCSNT